MDKLFKMRRDAVSEKLIQLRRHVLNDCLDELEKFMRHYLEPGHYYEHRAYIALNELRAIINATIDTPGARVLDDLL